MYLAELRFKVIADTTLTSAEKAIRCYHEALIFNGQIIGREFPTALQQDVFCSRIVLAHADALQPKQFSYRGKLAEEQLAAAGLAYPQLSILGQDLLSQPSCQTLPAELVLFTTFSDSCSPVRCAQTLLPVPLYWLASAATDHEALIRWQIQFQALDEIQLQAQRVLPKAAENSLQQLHSKLNRQGRQLARQLSQLNERPVFYALYSGSSANCTVEANKCCPSCKQPWRLPIPQADLFDFRCNSCQLLSNIAWECQSKLGE